MTWVRNPNTGVGHFTDNAETIRTSCGRLMDPTWPDGLSYDDAGPVRCRTCEAAAVAWCRRYGRQVAWCRRYGKLKTAWEAIIYAHDSGHLHGHEAEALNPIASQLGKVMRDFDERCQGGKKLPLYDGDKKG